jgi:Tol biopolymer transport system component/DNA-binding winged helix-turn-helix (wHTH) protein
MSQAPANGSSKVRFGPFEANLLTQELRNNGKRIRVPAQSFQVLQKLLDHPGDLVTREQLRSLLWPSDTFVDFEHGLNATVNRLRDALHDSADRPRWIETLPKRGYRFIGTIVPPAEPAAPPITLPALPEAPARVQPRTHSWKTAAWALGISLGVAAILAGYFLRLRPEASTVTLNPVPFTSYHGIETSPAFSPDGSRIAFAWNGDSASGGKGFDLYVKAIGSETLLRLTRHPSEWISPVWSPDGTQIAFHRLAGADTGLYVVPALGGPERKLRSTHIPYSVAAQINWSPDGKWISFDDPLPDRPGDRMFLLSPETLEVTPVPHNPACLNEANLNFSRTANSFLYLCMHNLNEFEVYSLAGVGGASKLITEFTSFPNGFAWSPDDSQLVISELTDKGAELVEIPVLGGSPRHLPRALDGTWPTLSTKGDKLAYSASSNSVNIWRKDLMKPDLPAIKVISSTRQQTGAQYSPDGKHIALSSNRAGPWNIWMQDPDGSNLVQITNLADGANGPNWSPDSKKIAFDLRRLGRYEIYIVDIDERVPRKLVTNVSQISSPAWSRDGKWIYFLSYETVGNKIYRCPASGGDALPVATPPDGANFLESFDGNSLYLAARVANTDLGMLSLTGAPPVSVVPGLPKIKYFGLWTLVPGGVYFVPHDDPRSLRYYDFSTKKTRRIFTIEKDFDIGLSISPDGRYVLFSQLDEENSDIMLVDHFN